MPGTCIAHKVLTDTLRRAERGGLITRHLDAYYAAAIDVTILKTEQGRIAIDVRSAEERLTAVDAHLAEWQEILETAMRFATNCATA